MPTRCGAHGGVVSGAQSPRCPRHSRENAREDMLPELEWCRLERSALKPAVGLVASALAAGEESSK